MESVTKGLIMKSKIFKIGFSALVIVSLTGCFKSKSEKFEDCNDKYYQQILEIRKDISSLEGLSKNSLYLYNSLARKFNTSVKENGKELEHLYGKEKEAVTWSLNFSIENSELTNKEIKELIVILGNRLDNYHRILMLVDKTQNECAQYFDSRDIFNTSGAAILASNYSIARESGLDAGRVKHYLEKEGIDYEATKIKRPISGQLFKDELKIKEIVGTLFDLRFISRY